MKYDRSRVINFPLSFAVAIKEYVASARVKQYRKNKDNIDYSEKTITRRGINAIKFCEYLIENGIYDFSDVGQSILDQYAEDYSRKEAEKAYNFLNFTSYNYNNLIDLQPPRFKRPAAWLMCIQDVFLDEIINNTKNIMEPDLRLCVLLLAVYGQTISKSTSLKLDSVETIGEKIFIKFHKYPIELDQLTKETLLQCRPNIKNEIINNEERIISMPGTRYKVKKFLLGHDPKKIRNTAILNVIKEQNTRGFSCLSDALDVSMPTLIWLAQSLSALHFNR
ncbi:MULTISPECIES: hypothetical protein [Deefgea]|uniref:Uncharacterized protein n=1 Tax=Deefgea chitinilytica TaxID=570276 RepID=A0ABS2CFE0_9NEIS|nr:MULTISPECIES: hypothetical protein [Deefgea]MBM5572106.1 hypothetical protein [Deefgea chitinilytica]MBM9889341.1 hypothetical protein [Deefgea sp. CFH1-16]